MSREDTRLMLAYRAGANQDRLGRLHETVASLLRDGLVTGEAADALRAELAETEPVATLDDARRLRDQREAEARLRGWGVRVRWVS